MRYLALDVGDERIGVAVSDAGALLARPLEVIARSRGAASFERIKELIAEYQVGAIVAGWPLLPDGSEGEQVRSTEAYLCGLAQHVTIPILRYDERDTTARAADLARASGRSRRRRARQLDAMAAAVILQSFLDEMAEERSA